MQIDLLLDSKTFGGIEAHVGQLSQALNAHGFKVTVVFLHDHGEHLLKQQLACANIPYTHIKGRGLTAIKQIMARKPKVLHTHGYKAGILGRIAGRLGGIAVCSSFHAGEAGHGRMALYQWLDTATARLAHQTIAVSHAIAKQLPKNTRTLPNFVAGKQPLSQGQQVAFVGRLSAEKGPDRFIQAANQFPHLSFHIYGDGPLMAQCQHMAAKHILFYGAQNMQTHWPNIGLLIMPSRFEGLPLAALEAMSRGIPFVATGAGDLPQLIQHKKNGWLINGAPENDADVIQDLITHVKAWQDLPFANHQNLQHNAQKILCDRYSAAAVLPQFLECYLTAQQRAYHV